MLLYTQRTFAKNAHICTMHLSALVGCQCVWYRHARKRTCSQMPAEKAQPTEHIVRSNGSSSVWPVRACPKSIGSFEFSWSFLLLALMCWKTFRSDEEHVSGNEKSVARAAQSCRGRQTSRSRAICFASSICWLTLIVWIRTMYCQRHCAHLQAACPVFGNRTKAQIRRYFSSIRCFAGKTHCRS